MPAVFFFSGMGNIISRKGFIYYSLQDDLSGGNSLGLVSATGHKRLSFYKYNEIIETVIE